MPTSLAAPTTDALRVVLVDDNADILESLAMVIQLLGHQSECCNDGEQGIERIASWKPHLALVDVGLPGISGHDVARAVRSSGAPDMPYLVAMTGWSRDEDRARIYAAGFDRHMVKPLEMSQLRELLQDVSQMHARGRSLHGSAPLNDADQHHHDR